MTVLSCGLVHSVLFSREGRRVLRDVFLSLCLDTKSAFAQKTVQTVVARRWSVMLINTLVWFVPFCIHRFLRDR